MTHKDEITQLLIKGDLTKAIEELLIGTKANGQTRLHNDLILQSARNNNNEGENNKGIIPADDYRRERARITYAMQSYLGDYLPLANTRINGDGNDPKPVQSKPVQATLSANKIFISYSSNDRDLRQIFELQLKVYLTSAKHKYEIIWSDVEIPTGSEWDVEIKTALNQSNIGILLISPMFLGSKYCLEEFKLMLERNKQGDFKIIPVLVRECNFQNNEELKRIQFFKTYKSEYGINDLIEERKLMPFDELVETPNPSKLHLNRYFLKVTEAIDKAIGK